MKLNIQNYCFDEIGAQTFSDENQNLGQFVEGFDRYSLMAMLPDIMMGEDHEKGGQAISPAKKSFIYLKP